MKRLKVEKHPFEPFVPKGAKYLILGSFSGKEFTQEKTENGWYYGSSRNQFWKILEEVYRVKLPAIKDKQELLEKLKIAMTDIILSCKRSEDSNADKCLIKKTYNRKAIKNILTNNDIEKIFFTSKWVGAEFRENFKEIDYNKEIIDLPSPSPIFRRMSFKDKVNKYREVLPKMQNNKITDKDTNYVYLSDLLKNRFPAFYTKLTAIFDKHGMKYNLLKGTKDIWCRDYMPIQISKNKFVQFRYDPDYLVGQEHLKTDPGPVCDSIGIKPIKSELIIDGGNVIKSKDSVILTDKIFKENKNIEREELLEQLRSLFETEEIIIISRQPYDYLGHADGMLRYYDESTVIANDFSKTDSASFQDRFKKSLEKSELNIKNFPYKFVPEKNKDGIFVAIGVYINYLRVDNLIVFPTFDIPEDDIALKEIKKLYPNASIEPIDSNEIAYYGGVLNCISWTILK